MQYEREHLLKLTDMVDVVQRFVDSMEEILDAKSSQLELRLEVLMNDYQTMSIIYGNEKIFSKDFLLNNRNAINLKLRKKFSLEEDLKQEHIESYKEDFKLLLKVREVRNSINIVQSALKLQLTVTDHPEDVFSVLRPYVTRIDGLLNHSLYIKHKNIFGHQFPLAILNKLETDHNLYIYKVKEMNYYSKTMSGLYDIKCMDIYDLFIYLNDILEEIE